MKIDFVIVILKLNVDNYFSLPMCGSIKEIGIFLGVSLWAFRLRSCPQGRRAAGCANASVLRFASHWANAHPPHASRSSLGMFYLVRIYTFVLPCLMLIIKYLKS
ncbi:MAG: hypothetical protein NZ519_13025 [Bacteroidia bacterium]|nr:hypothetical protein [Bacteroidia bacterium]